LLILINGENNKMKQNHTGTLKEYLEKAEGEKEINRKDQEYLNYLRSMGIIVFTSEEVKGGNN
jgi:hypothetical protein